jgi:streptogramin lyase
VSVPGEGVALYGDHSLWVTAVEGANAGGNVSTGTLDQIDPGSGEVLDRIPGVIGGWPSVGAGAIWLSSVGPEVLTRIDLANHAVTRIAIHHPKQHPQGSAVAQGNVWVINNASGDLLRMDPATYRVTRTVHLGANTQGTAPRSIISDGQSVWVSDDNGLIQRFDGATGDPLSHLQLPFREVLFDGIDRGRHVLYAHPLRGNTVAEIGLDQKGTTWEGREVSLSSNVDSLLLAFAVGPDSLWAVTSSPDQLLRIDPSTFKIAGHMPLPGIDHESNVPVAMVTGGGGVWIRIQGKVLELRPTS